MAITGFNIDFYINYGAVVAPKVVITDTTNYPGQGINSADLNGNLRITAPSGIVIYENTDFSDAGCDMPATIFPPGLDILLPTMANGNVQNGSYKILYITYNKVTLQYNSLERTVDFSYLRPKLSVVNTVDYELSLFVSKDQTNYDVNNVTPVFFVYDHNLYYPHGSAGENTPILTSDLIIQTSTFYPGTQSAMVQALLFWTFDDTSGNTFIVYDTVKGTVDTLVSTNTLCDVYCCMKKLFDKVKDAKCAGNDKLYLSLSAKLAAVGAIAEMVGIAKTCGHTNDIPVLIDEIKDILDCSDGCADC